MRAEYYPSGKLTLPLSYVLPADQNEFSTGAKVIFHGKDMPQVVAGPFAFQGNYLSKTRPADLPVSPTVSTAAGLPLFSILAVVLIIVFRNLFYHTFQNYFLSIRNNFEFDFNVQKIGVLPVFLGIIIIVFALFDFFRLYGSANTSSLLISLQIVFYPMMVSAAAVFLFAASIRIFPVIFPDIKILFFTSLAILIVNFAGFSQPAIILPFLKFLPFLFVFSYFLLRSILFLGVLVKFYRFRTKLTLFYICTLNLTTCLILHKVLY